jgi:hypothetical protein
MTLSSMVPHEASSEHSEGSSHLLDSTFGSRYGQSSLPKYVFAFASLFLCLCLYGSMIFLLIFIAIISSFVRSLSDFNRVGIHWQLGHPRRQVIRSWQRINCMCRKKIHVCFLLGNYSNCMFLLLNLFVLSHLLYYEQFFYTPWSWSLLSCQLSA